MMDESRYLQLADGTFRKVADAFDQIDPDVVEAYFSGDVLTLAFKNGVRAVLNTQRPTRQVWLAANARAWHFSFDEAKSQWLDDKGRGEELFATLATIVREQAGLTMSFSAD